MSKICPLCEGVRSNNDSSRILGRSEGRQLHYVILLKLNDYISILYVRKF